MIKSKMLTLFHATQMKFCIMYTKKITLFKITFNLCQVLFILIKKKLEHVDYMSYSI